MAKRAEVAIGTRFGRWTVIGPAPNRGDSQYLACRCDCGTVREVSFGSLNGRVKAGVLISCGCVQQAPPLIRFWRRVELGGYGCWLWTGSLNQYGYAQFAVSQREQVLAHRWAYENFIGPIPEGEQIDHLCNNRRCVNPDHMEPVTLRENLKRGKRSNQYVGQTRCRKGHDYTPENTRLTPSGVRVCKTCRREYNRRVAERMRAKRRADPTYGKPALRGE